MEALFGVDSSFIRTPKFCVRTWSDGWKQKRYRARMGLLPLIEISFGIYFAFMVGYSIETEIYFTIPFLLLFMVGYFYTGLMSLFQSFQIPRAVSLYH